MPESSGIRRGYGAVAWCAAVGLALVGCGGSSTRTVTHTAATPVTSTTSSGGPARTSGGGQTTAPGAPPGGSVQAGFRAQSVTFVSPSEGWVLGTASCSSPPCTSVLRTTDGGSIWHGIPAPRVALSSRGGSGLSELRFADSKDGFAFAPQLWVTHDGGGTWQSSPVPGGGQIVALAASDGRVFAVVQRGANLNDEVFESAVAQLAWRSVLTVKGPVNQGGLALYGPAAWLAFGSGIYTTPDGNRWTLRHPCPFAYNFATGVSLTSTTDGVVACGGEGFAGHELKRVYGSADGGRTFNLLGSPPPLGALTEIAATSEFGVTVAAASGASLLYGSFDGGRRYAVTLSRDDGGNGWRDLGFTTAQQGVVVEAGDSPGLLWMTHDGGRHWAQVRFG